MSKLSKPGVAVVFSLLLGLALFTTGAFAQSADQKIDRGQIRVSARAAVVNARGVRRPYGWGGGWDGGDGWGGRCGWGRCNGGFGLRQAFRETVRCASQRVCRSVLECRWSRWGRVCRSIRICKRISVCRLCRTRVGWSGGSWGNSWAVKQTLTGRKP